MTKKTPDLDKKMRSYRRKLKSVLGNIANLTDRPVNSTKDVGRVYEMWVLAQFVEIFRAQGFPCSFVDASGNPTSTLSVRGGPGFLGASDAGAVRVVIGGVEFDIVNSVMWRGTFSGNNNETDLAIVRRDRLDGIRTSTNPEPFCGTGIIECKYRTNPGGAMGQGFVAEQLGRLHEFWTQPTNGLRYLWFFATALTLDGEQAMYNLSQGVEEWKRLLFGGWNPMIGYAYLPAVRHARHEQDAIAAGAL